jgi:hypothetical protein
MAITAPTCICGDFDLEAMLYLSRPLTLKCHFETPIQA